MSTEVKFIGLDVSLNHLGMCHIGPDGELRAWAFLTDTKKFVIEDPVHGTLYKQPSARSDHPDHFRRIQRFTSFVMGRIRSAEPCVWPCIVNIEGYALNSKNTRLYETAELTGNIKVAVARWAGKLRVHDPDTIKLFACNYGHATKDQIYMQFIDETGVSVPITWLKQGNKKILSGPGTDVADAYFLARMGWMEHQLRTAQIKLQELPEHLQRIFIRETKAYPLNLLDRPYAELGAKCNA